MPNNPIPNPIGTPPTPPQGPSNPFLNDGHALSAHLKPPLPDAPPPTQNPLAAPPAPPPAVPPAGNMRNNAPPPPGFPAPPVRDVNPIPGAPIPVDGPADASGPFIPPQAPSAPPQGPPPDVTQAVNDVGAAVPQPPPLHQMAPPVIGMANGAGSAAGIAGASMLGGPAGAAAGMAGAGAAATSSATGTGDLIRGQPQDPTAVQATAQQHIQNLSPAALRDAAQAGMQVVNQALTPMHALVEVAAETGQIPPQVTQQAAERLTNMGHDPRSAMEIVRGMDTGSQFLMAAGLGLGAIGLISALSGQGGPMAFIMAALGLGTAAGTAAHGGVFGRGPQQMVQGLLGGITGGGRGLGELTNHLLSGNLSPEAWNYVFRQLPQDAQSQLDMAVGHGGMGNQFASWVGNTFGQTQRGLADLGITDPQRQEALLNAWRRYRGMS